MGPVQKRMERLVADKFFLRTDRGRWLEVLMLIYTNPLSSPIFFFPKPNPQSQEKQTNPAHTMDKFISMSLFFLAHVHLTANMMASFALCAMLSVIQTYAGILRCLFNGCLSLCMLFRYVGSNDAPHSSAQPFVLN